MRHYFCFSSLRLVHSFACVLGEFVFVIVQFVLVLHCISSFLSGNGGGGGGGGGGGAFN